MTLTQLIDRYMFYVVTLKEQIDKQKYMQGFGYKLGILEDNLEESEAVLKILMERVN